MAHDYCIAVDVGTSRVAAAIASVGPNAVRAAAAFPLGRNSDSAPAVAFIGDDGQVLLGDAAERRGLTEPQRLIREFKRSLGDDVPFLVAGQEISAHSVFAHTVSSVLSAATEREGCPATQVVLTHPVAWGPHRIGLVRDALAAAGHGEVDTISEPEAAARHYEATHDIEAGKVVVVYDLGGGTFDLAALRKGDDGGLEIIGTPIGLDDLGGADFDDEVIRHVVRSSGLTDELTTADDDDARVALAQLRRECVEAKEALSFDTEASIPLLVPPHRTSIRLTRAEFEGMIAPGLERTVQAMDDLLHGAGVDPVDVAAILLVGGSSRIPLVTQVLSERFAAPIAVDADPKSSMALGAARWGLRGKELAASAAGGREPDPITGDELALPLADALSPADPTGDDADHEPGGHRWYAAALVAGAAVIAGGIILGGSVAAGLGPATLTRVTPSSTGGSDSTAQGAGDTSSWTRDTFSAGQASSDSTAESEDTGHSTGLRGDIGLTLVPGGMWHQPATASNSAEKPSSSQHASTTPTPTPTPSKPGTNEQTSAPNTQEPTTTAPDPTPTSPPDPGPTPSAAPAPEPIVDQAAEPIPVPEPPAP